MTMPQDGRSIYQICRQQAGYTQERAAELLSCSVRALCRYESGEVPVPDAIAYEMVRLYNSQYLAVEHLRKVSQVAAELLPTVDVCTIQTAALRLYNAMSDFAAIHPDRQLLRIAEDGDIDEAERPVLDDILDSLERLTKVFTEVRLAADWKKEEYR